MEQNLASPHHVVMTVELFSELDSPFFNLNIAHAISGLDPHVLII